MFNLKPIFFQKHRAHEFRFEIFCYLSFLTSKMLTKNLTESVIKFIYSEKATKFCEISNLLLTGTTKDKIKVEISQNFVAFSEYINLKG